MIAVILVVDHDGLMFAHRLRANIKPAFGPRLVLSVVQITLSQGHLGATIQSPRRGGGLEYF